MLSVDLTVLRAWCGGGGTGLVEGNFSWGGIDRPGRCPVMFGADAGGGLRSRWLKLRSGRGCSEGFRR